MQHLIYGMKEESGRWHVASGSLCLASFPHWGESSGFQMFGRVGIEARA